MIRMIHNVLEFIVSTLIWDLVLAAEQKYKLTVKAR